MPHVSNDKYAAMVGPSMTKKQIVEVYDDYYGRYACNVEGTMKNSPSKDTKSPLKGMTGGK
jgi:hypothetical protein